MNFRLAEVGGSEKFSAPVTSVWRKFPKTNTRAVELSSSLTVTGDVHMSGASLGGTLILTGDLRMERGSSIRGSSVSTSDITVRAGQSLSL